MVRREVFLLVRSEHLTLLEPHKHTSLRVSFETFLLSKQAARCAAKTLVHHRYTVGNSFAFLHRQRGTSIQQIAPNHIRRRMVELRRQGLKNTT